jgi:predicted DNA-binding protein (UPF0251 family)
MIDRESLTWAIRHNGLTNEKAANAMGLSRDTFQRKLRGDISFTVDNITTLRRIIPLSDAEVINIFFSDYILGCEK